MKVLFDIVHPAHVHLFRNFIIFLKSEGHEVVITSRSKDITSLLLDHYKFDHVCISKPAKGLGHLLMELIRRDMRIVGLHRKHKFDLAYGTSVSIGHLSLVSRVKSFNFNEDDDDVAPLYALLAYPFCTKIMMPATQRYKHFATKRLNHNSYHELAYLHPNNFTPDPAVLKKYGLTPHKYVIARFSALAAHHDVGAQGISGHTWEQVEKKLTNTTVIKSIENEKTHQIKPWDMHHVLAFARLLISDSQTMTVEAAVLGVPSIRYNTFVGRASILEELEHKYNLTIGYIPGAKAERLMLAKISELLSCPDIITDWQAKRQQMLKDKCDLNNWMVNHFRIITNESADSCSRT